MIIVSDTTPISELAKVGYVMLLPKLFGTVMIPEGVLDQMKSQGTRISDRLYNQVLTLAQELKN